MSNESAVDASLWRLTLHDITSSSARVFVTLRSGAQFSGRYNSKLSEHECLRINTDDGYVDIDWNEIAAIEGRVVR